MVLRHQEAHPEQRIDIFASVPGAGLDEAPSYHLDPLPQLLWMQQTLAQAQREHAYCVRKLPADRVEAQDSSPCQLVPALIHSDTQLHTFAPRRDDSAPRCTFIKTVIDLFSIDCEPRLSDAALFSWQSAASKSPAVASGFMTLAGGSFNNSPWFEARLPRVDLWTHKQECVSIARLDLDLDLGLPIYSFFKKKKRLERCQVKRLE
jgi:hypothetical protein